MVTNAELRLQERNELLDALEGMVGTVERYWKSKEGLDRTLCTGAMADAVNRAEKAIAKAKGV